MKRLVSHATPYSPADYVPGDPARCASCGEVYDEEDILEYRNDPNGNDVYCREGCWPAAAPELHRQMVLDRILRELQKVLYEAKELETDYLCPSESREDPLPEMLEWFCSLVERWSCGQDSGFREDAVMVERGVIEDAREVLDAGIDIQAIYLGHSMAKDPEGFPVAQAARVLAAHGRVALALREAQERAR